jgi:hypothetical protein
VWNRTGLEDLSPDADMSAHVTIRLEHRGDTGTESNQQCGQGDQ